MNIPSAGVGRGQSLNGKVSWFGGPHDPTDSGHTASGGTTAEPGIAVYNRATLGGYWRVTGANGRTAVLKQTDLGPAPWTGRKIDVTYSALGKLGYNEGNFPTDSQFKAEYLGSNAGTQPQQSAPPKAPTVKVPGTPASSELDVAALRKAQTDTALAKLLSPGERPSFLSTKEPNPSEYVKSVPGTPARTVAQPPPQGEPQRGGTKLGGFLSASAPLQYNRLDEGQDVQTRPGEALLAPGDGVVIAVKVDPSGFGPDYPVVKFTSGPMAGKSVYLGHTDTALQAGAKFRAGQTIAHTSKTGHNAPPGWAEIGEGQTLGEGNKGQGARIAPYLRK